MNKLNILTAIDIIEDIIQNDKAVIDRSLLLTELSASENERIRQLQIKCVSLDEAVEELSKLVREKEVPEPRPYSNNRNSQL